ncbi:hypothetical protein CR513_18459, partial [Mucuna pruriens]
MLLQLPLASSCNNTLTAPKMRDKLCHNFTRKFVFIAIFTLIMSSIEVVSGRAFNCKLPYQILRHEAVCDNERERVVLRPKKWCRLGGVPVKKKRFRLKLPSWRRVWMVKKVRLVCAKVKKRFKEGQGHFGDLFAGNYVFTQINPTSLKYLENKLAQSKIA